MRHQVRLALLGTTLAVTAPGAMAAMITVDSTGDMSSDGQCTLRDAITAANQNEVTGGCVAGDAASDTILFDGVDAITLNGTALPTVISGSTLTIGMADDESTTDTDESTAVTIDANSMSRIFVNQGDLTLNGLTLTNGVTSTTASDSNDDRSGGAILNDDGGVLEVNGGAMTNNTSDRAGGAIEEASGAAAGMIAVTLNDVDFSGNDAGINPGNGGALHVTGAGDIVVEGGTFSGNLAEEGGALWNNQGTMTVTDATFTENVANGTAADMGGGAIFGQVEGASGTIVISGSTFESNMAGNDDDSDSSASGGAILTGDGSTLTIADSVFRMNRARRAGGVIEALAGSTTTLTNVTATGNDAGMNPGNGGVLHVTGDGNVMVTGGIYARNTAVEGGAFWNNQGEMTLDGVSIVNNEATGGEADQGGGGVFANPASDDNTPTLTIMNSRIAMNSASGASGNGGGVMVTAGVEATITDTLIQSNMANRAGAGVENAGGTLSLERVTLGGASSDMGNVIQNPMPGNGGGLHNTGTATITDSSVGYNDANEGGGLWNAVGGSLTVDTSTVSNNSANVGAAGVYQDGGDSDGAATNGGIMLDYASIVNHAGIGLGAANATGAFTVTNSLIAANDTNLSDDSFATNGEDGNVIGDVSLLDGAYRLYGGPTPTQPLAMDSAALDTNDCDATDTDQRGAQRDFDVPDVDNGGTCDSGAYELTDDPVVQVEMVELEDVVVTQEDSEAAVLGFTLTNNSDESVTLGGFSGYVDRDDMLPQGIDLADVELTVYEDINDNGSYEMGSDMDVGSGSLDNGYTFTVAFQDGAGVSIAAGDSTTYLVVARLSDDDTAAPATTQTTSVSGFGGAPLYAGGALLGLLGLVSVGGIRRRTQFLLIVAALALTLTACSDGDGDVDVDNNGNGQVDDGMDPMDPPMGQGQASFVLQQLNTSSTSDSIVIGDGLPVSGPVVSFEMPSDDDSMSDDG